MKANESHLRNIAIGTACLFAFALLSAVGCSRAAYRRRADRDANNLVAQKANNPHWAIPFYRPMTTPDSRMFDPYNPDKEPLPPDDPAAHVFMHRVDGKNGWRKWHRNGDTPYVQNPDWLNYVPLNEQGVFTLSADEAVRQAYLNSPNYQREMEEVYLTALDVSFERFRFETQFFAGYQVDYLADGPDRAGGGGNSRSLLTVGTFPAASGVRLNRFFTTGAELVVGFANSLVWQFSGPDDYQGNTLIDFALVQPLLRDAGKARVQERLTRAERTLLYNVRALERYRQAFYVQVITGRDAGAGPSRAGGAFGGAGLEGFTGTSGGFGRVASTAGSGGGSQSGATGAGAGVAGGYLGLLQQQQQIENQEDNIVRLRDNVAQLETKLQELLTTRAATDTILRQRLQVAQARQALLNAQSRLLNSQNQYQSDMDNFKAVLGLPPQLNIAIQDNLIDDFKLIDRETNELQVRNQELQEEVGDVNRNIIESVEEKDDEATGIPRRSIQWSPALKRDLESLAEFMPAMKELVESLKSESLATAEKNIEELVAATDRRTAALQRLRDTYQNDKVEIGKLLPVKDLDDRVFDPKRLQVLPERLADEHARLQTQLDSYGEKIEKLRKAIDTILSEGKELGDEARFAQLRDNILLSGQDLLIDLRFDVLALQLLQARAKAESIQLAQVDMRAECALEVARRYRQDWMNARGALVDQWRLIEFNANLLEGSLDIVFSGDISNKGDNPINLRGSTGRLRAGVQFDAPITRLAERNVYRQTLIEYQQARRTYYTFEDAVARGLRSQLRTIAANQLNFELQRFAVLQAAEQITLNDDISAHQEATGQASGVTAARDAVSALSDLLDAQNNFMSVYVNYEVLRRQLDLDLGTMQIDREGHWLDPGVMGPDYGARLYSDECEPPPLPFTDCQIQQMIDWFDQKNEEEAAAKKEELPAVTETDMELPKPSGKK